MNDDTKDCEVSISGKWPQRANGSLTSSGKSKCTTSHSAQLKARAVKERANHARSTREQVCLMSLWRRLCTCEVNRNVVDSARTASSAKCNSGKPQIAMSS